MPFSHAGRLVVTAVTALAVGPLTGLATAPPASATTPASPPRGTTGSSWTNLGPTASAFEFNGVTTTHSSSGRVTKVRPDPANPAQVYVATAGGGIWKTPDITAATPTWTPLTDSQPSVATGALAIDPSHSGTLYAGLGETYDPPTGGGGPGAVIKSTDGGATWSAPVSLAGTFAATTVSAQAVRDLAVDPHNSQVVLAATDIGLFRSTDGGASYAHADLPSAPGPAQTYSLGYVGAIAGTSTWVVSGTRTGTSPLDASTLGDIWRSSDAGATWTSLRAANKLPTAVSLGGEYGHIVLGAAPAENAPTTATLYAVVADDSSGSSTRAIFKSTDGGQTFTTVATGTTATANPPTSHSCSNMNVGHSSSWYSLSVAVDPANANSVFVGGDLCSYRSTNGGTTWDVATYWLPESGGTTVNGVLPYVHQYVQDIALVDTAGGVRAVVGSGGGIGLGTNVFGGSHAEQVTWSAPNTGLSTFQFSSVAAGDSSTGDAGVVFGGAGSTGVRIHAPSSPAGSFDQTTGNWALGASIGRTSGGATVYWTSILGQALYCQAADSSWCDAGAHWSNGPDWSNGTTDPVTNIYYSAIPGDANGRQLTSSTYDVFALSSASPATFPVNLSPSHFLVSATKTSIRYVDASQFPSSGHEYIGVTLANGYAAAGDYNGSTATWTVASAQSPLNLGTSTAFPRHAASLGGSTDGSTYLLSSEATSQRDGSAVPASVGHLFLTKDAGASWTPFHGNGSGADLPNVAVNKVMFDPADQTDSVIYAGTATGVYVTWDTGATWHRLGSGLPNAAVKDIWLSPDSRTMTVATYGRGIWQLALHQTTSILLGSNDPAPKDRESVQLTATLAPGDAGGTVEFTDGGVSLGSSTASGGVATLSTPALTPGSHSFQASYGGDLTHEPSTGSLTLNVAALQSVTVAPSPVTGTAGDAQQLMAVAHYSDGSAADVTNSVTWASDTPGVATVSATGLLTGVAPGTAVATATATGSDGPHAGSTAVTITAPTGGGGSGPPPPPATGPPTVAIGSVPRVTLASSVSVTFSGSETNGQITSYDVRYHVAGPLSTAWSAWSAPTRVTVTRVAMPIALGQTRCAQVRSRDAAGATSGWSGPACTARALDDKSLVASAGWTRVTGRAFYGGSIRLSKRTGSTLTLKGAHIDRIGLVVTKCAACGALDVLVNGKVFKTVSLKATSTHNRVLVMLPAFAYKTAKVVLRTRSTRPVKVDGLVATRI